MQKKGQSIQVMKDNPWEGLERTLTGQHRISWIEKVDEHRYRFHPFKGHSLKEHEFSSLPGLDVQSGDWEESSEDPFAILHHRMD